MMETPRAPASEANSHLGSKNLCPYAQAPLTTSTNTIPLHAMLTAFS
eukprot:gene6258-12669_t